MPVGACCFKEALRQCSEVFHALAAILKSRGLATSVGDEGGFAPDLSSDEETIEVILEAIEKAGYKPEKDFMLAMDAAASEWKGEVKGEYVLPKAKTKFTSMELISHWEKLVGKYPIMSIEDALDEEDWEGWQVLTKRLGERVQLVGDDDKRHTGFQKPVRHGDIVRRRLVANIHNLDAQRNGIRLRKVQIHQRAPAVALLFGYLCVAVARQVNQICLLVN